MAASSPGVVTGLGKFGAWLNPRHDDDARVRFVVEAEAMGYRTAWLGFGSAALGDLRLVERALDATERITVATAIVNMWTNKPDVVADAYHRIAARHPERFLLGVGIGHPESIAGYRSPYDTMVGYLDALDAAGVPTERRILAALGPRALHLAAAAPPERTRTASFPSTPDARTLLGPGAVLAPNTKSFSPPSPPSPAGSAGSSSPSRTSSCATTPTTSAATATGTTTSRTVGVTTSSMRLSSTAASTR